MYQNFPQFTQYQPFGANLPGAVNGRNFHQNLFEANNLFFQQTNENIRNIQKNINNQFQNTFNIFPCIPYQGNNGNYNANNENFGTNHGNSGVNNENYVNPGNGNGNYIPPFPGASTLRPTTSTTENLDILIDSIFTTPPSVTTNKDGLIYNIDVRLDNKHD